MLEQRLTIMMSRPATTAAAAATLLALGACGDSVATATPSTAPPTPTCDGFALSLVSDRGGAPTRIEAVQDFLRSGGVSIPFPTSGWAVAPDGSGRSTTTSGDSTLHLVHGSDGTWQVDSGQRCGP
jgi:hypothetical protein